MIQWERVNLAVERVIAKHELLVIAEQMYRLQEPHQQFARVIWYARFFSAFARWNCLHQLPPNRAAFVGARAQSIICLDGRTIPLETVIDLLKATLERQGATLQ